MNRTEIGVCGFGSSQYFLQGFPRARRNLQSLWRYTTTVTVGGWPRKAV